MKKQLWRKCFVSKRNQIINVILSVSFVSMAISGFLLHPLHGILLLKIIHKLSSVIFVISCMLHVFQHRSKNREKIHVS